MFPVRRALALLSGVPVCRSAAGGVLLLPVVVVVGRTK